VSDAERAYETGPAESTYHRGLPIGERVSAEPLTGSPFFGFEGDIAVKPLEPMLVPERPRSGEYDAGECFHCGPGTEHAIWIDENWHVGAPPSFGLPFVAGLAPNAHVRLDEMSGELLTSFGEIVQRLAGAIQALDGVARTHFARWGDGSAHFHMHFMARPLGMMQGRGPMLAFWDDVLPPVDPDLIARSSREVARALAAVSGQSLL
jgi:diadenosine tetraphosphate (Ap4A) HIT family hydrolase